VNGTRNVKPFYTLSAPKMCQKKAPLNPIVSTMQIRFEVRTLISKIETKRKINSQNSMPKVSISNSSLI